MRQEVTGYQREDQAAEGRAERNRYAREEEGFDRNGEVAAEIRSYDEGAFAVSPVRRRLR